MNEPNGSQLTGRQQRMAHRVDMLWKIAGVIAAAALSLILTSGVGVLRDAVESQHELALELAAVRAELASNRRQIERTESAVDELRRFVMNNPDP